VHLRRALLLFAIVLGVAALVGSIAAPPSDDGGPDEPVATTPPPTATTRAPTAAAQPAPKGTVELTFAVGGRRERRSLAPGAAATVVVASAKPGQVDLEGLGVTDAVQPNTPARFAVLSNSPGTYPVVFRPAGGADDFERVGELVVTKRR
jgi:hypothetical protein